MADSIEYVAHAVVTKSVIRKLSGNVTVVAFDIGEAVLGKISAFGTLIQVIEGKAEVLL